MSIDTTVFMGPFVACSTKKAEQTEQIRTCSNEHCTNYTNKYWDTSNKFCSLCGSEIKLRDVTKIVDNVDPYELRMAIDENLYNVPGDSFSSWSKKNDVQVWLPNKTIPESRKFSFDPDHEDYPPMIPVSSEMIAMEMMQFSDFFHNEIELLRKSYGYENVTVRWGLIHYFC